jgi:hypothetical protein
LPRCSRKGSRAAPTRRTVTALLGTDVCPTRCWSAHTRRRTHLAPRGVHGDHRLAREAAPSMGACRQQRLHGVPRQQAPAALTELATPLQLPHGP